MFKRKTKEWKSAEWLLCAHTGVGEERRNSLQPPGDEIMGQTGNRDRLTFTGDTEEHIDGLGHRYCCTGWPEKPL